MTRQLLGLVLLFAINSAHAAQVTQVLALSFVEPRGTQNEATLINGVESRARLAGMLVADCRAILNVQAGVIDDFRRALIDSPRARDKSLGQIVEQLQATGCLPEQMREDSVAYIARILIEVDPGRNDRRSATVVFHQLKTGLRREGRYEEPAPKSEAEHSSWIEIVDRATRRALEGTNAKPIIQVDALSEATVGNMLKLSAAGTYDPDGDPIEIKWACHVLLREDSARRLNVFRPQNQAPLLYQPQGPFELYDEGGDVDWYAIAETDHAVHGETSFGCPIPTTGVIHVSVVARDPHGGESQVVLIFDPEVRSRSLIGINNVFPLTGRKGSAVEFEGGDSVFGHQLDGGMGIEGLVVFGYRLEGGLVGLWKDTKPEFLSSHALFAGLRIHLNFSPIVAGYLAMSSGAGFLPEQTISVPGQEGSSDSGSEELVKVDSQVFVEGRLLGGLEIGPFSNLFTHRLDGERRLGHEKTVLAPWTRVGVGVGIGGGSHPDPSVDGKGVWLLLEFSLGVRF